MILKKGIVLGLYEQESKCDPLRFTSRGEIFDNRLEGKLMEVVQQTGITGKIGQARVFNGIDKEFGSVCVVGLGKEGVGFCELEMLDEGMVCVRSIFCCSKISQFLFLFRKMLELPQELVLASSEMRDVFQFKLTPWITQNKLPKEVL